MNRFSKDLRDLALLLGLGLVVGWLLGEPAWALLAAALLYIVMQRREFNTFSAWAGRPLRRPDNRRESWRTLANGLYRTITRSRGRTREALRQLHALRTLSEALPDATVLIDGAGNIEQFNQAAVRLLMG